MKKQKQVNVHGLGDVVIVTYEGKRLAKMKDSSFLVSATGQSDEEAIQNLKKTYEELSNKFQNSD